MEKVLELVFKKVMDAPNSMDVIDWLFGEQKDDVLNGKPVVLFGTESLGQEFFMLLKQYGISPKCFCNSDVSLAEYYCSLPVISIETLMAEHKDSVILISTQTYAASIKRMLLEKRFKQEQVLWPTNFDPLKGLYFSTTNLDAMGVFLNESDVCRGQVNRAFSDILIDNKDKIEKVYYALADEKSKEILINKLAFSLRCSNIQLFIDFLSSFSEPVNLFGSIPYPDPGPENYFYFNNDVFSLANDEVYVDVGAYDGDSISAFVQACNLNNVGYRKIYAFEPDPKTYNALIENTKDLDAVDCHQLGLWSESANLDFMSSDNSGTPSGAKIVDGDGDFSIKTVSLDSFLQGEAVTIIKMDPPGNIIPEALKGAFNTIDKYQPKLVLGAYHSFEAIFEIPFLVHTKWPEYKLYIRHNSWASCETDLYAIR